MLCVVVGVLMTDKAELYVSVWFVELLLAGFPLHPTPHTPKHQFFQSGVKDVSLSYSITPVPYQLTARWRASLRPEVQVAQTEGRCQPFRIVRLKL